MTNAEIRWRNARELAKQAGGPARFAEKMEMSDSQTTQIIGDKPIRNIGNTIARRIEEKFTLEKGWLDREHDEIALEHAIPVAMDRRAPIVGIAIGGPDGYVNIDDNPPGHGDGFVASTSTDPHAYAIRVRGDSMRPRIRTGEFIIVEPSHEAQPGSDVVVKLKDGRAMVKEWMWTRDGDICLGSVNDNFPPITLSMADVEYMHKVAAILPRDSQVHAGTRSGDNYGAAPVEEMTGEVEKHARVLFKNNKSKRKTDIR